MTTDLFSQAQAQLRLVDVFLRGARVEVHESFDPRSIAPGDQPDSQYKHLVTAIERLTPADDDADADVFFRAVVELAIRWGKYSDESEKDEGFSEMGRIEATYVAEYVQKSELSPECLEAFAFRAPSFHVWPYWREFAASMCARLNLPKIVMPPMQFAQNMEDEGSLGETSTSSKVLYAANKEVTPKPEKNDAQRKRRGKKN